MRGFTTESLDEVIERCAIGCELGAVSQLLRQEKQHMPTEAHSVRLAEVRQQIRALQLAEHPVVRLVYPDGPHEHKLTYRSWSDVPESAKLSMLQDLVDWSGVSNKAMASILLSELDVGKLTSGQRDMLIRLAEPAPSLNQDKVSLNELKQTAARRQPAPAKQREHGIER